MGVLKDLQPKLIDINGCIYLRNRPERTLVNADRCSAVHQENKMSHSNAQVIFILSNAKSTISCSYEQATRILLKPGTLILEHENVTEQTRTYARSLTASVQARLFAFKIFSMKQRYGGGCRETKLKHSGSGRLAEHLLRVSCFCGGAPFDAIDTDNRAGP